MVSKRQERFAVDLLIAFLEERYGRHFLVVTEGGNDFPDFILEEPASGARQWVEIVEAVESGMIRAAESKAERIYRRVKADYVSRGEEVVLHVSEHGVVKVVPAPGYGVTGILLSHGPRRIWPDEWVQAALTAKADPARYQPSARARTWLVIDCTNEILLGPEDVERTMESLQGNTLGFAQVWCVSRNWGPAKALLVAP